MTIYDKIVDEKQYAINREACFFEDIRKFMTKL